MAAGKVDLHLEQGAALDKRFIKKHNGLPDSLVGYTAKMQIRPDFGDEDILVDLSTTLVAGNGIVLGGLAGTIQIIITATTTGTLDVPVDGGKLGEYDMFLIPDGDAARAFRILRGRVTIDPRVTEI